MSALLESLKALGPKRLGAMGVVAAGVLGLLALLALRGGGERMALLYADLDLREAGQVVEALDRARVAHEVEAGGSRVLVPAGEVARARLLLAKDGLPSGGSIGYEIFDRGDGLTASAFQQGINQTRALEGELARTIRVIQGVRAARVHLVLPRREPFARDKQDAQASVVLTMTGAARLDREGTQAVLNLVAAAVPGLRAGNIAVVDSRGNVLARAGEPVGPAAAAQTGEEIRRAAEQRLSRAVEEMLERGLGPGRVRAEAAVEMDFDRVSETQERFDPDGQVVRSTQSTTDTSRSTEANANSVSVGNNLPNADAGQAPAPGSQEQKNEETTNYEISKTVRTVVREGPQMRRISLAVLVDGADDRGSDGAATWRERTPEELARIGALVRSAIGFNEARGDKVEVVNMRFASAEEAGAPEARGPLGLPLERADLLRLGETALLAVAGLLAALLVLRPLALRLAAVPVGDAGAPAAAGAIGNAATDAGPGTAVALPGTAPAMIGDESMVGLSSVEGQMRASSLRRVAELVDGHPEESLAIVRGWMAAEGR